MSERHLSKWIVVDGDCAALVLEGDDSEDPLQRRAFIEKTPRVQVPGPGVYTDDDGCVVNALQGEWNGVEYWWIYGPKGHGGACYSDAHGDYTPHGGPNCNHYGFDPESRAWCERRLIELGYKFGD